MKVEYKNRLWEKGKSEIIDLEDFIQVLKLRKAHWPHTVWHEDCMDCVNGKEYHDEWVKEALKNAERAKSYEI